MTRLKNGLLALMGALSLASCSTISNKTDILDSIPEKYRAGVEKAIVAAGPNSSQLKDTLEAFRNDPQKLEAASFLVSETPRRMHRQHPVDYDWDLAHKDYTEIIDATVVKSKDLIDNVNWSFVAKDRFPWAQEIYEGNKDLFFSGVLPYRLGTASLDQLPGIDGHWRAMFLDEKVFNAVKEKYGLKTEFRDIKQKLDELVDSYRKANGVSEKDAVLTEFTRFVELDFMNKEGLRYFARGPEEKTLGVFLTPEEKDGEMRRGGRCTDGDNNHRYAHMAVGIPTSSIRFIAWPTGDENHEVIRVQLPGQPFDMSTCVHRDESAPLNKHVPGKVGTVYEERWGTRDASSELVWNLKEGEKLPWYMGFYLRTRSTVNVTDRYGPTTDVRIQTSKPGQIAYLGVLNNSSDTQIGTATVAIDRTDSDGLAEFKTIGADSILYFPYTYDVVNGEPHATPISTPFALRRDGTKQQFGLDTGKDYSTKALDGLQPSYKHELLTFDNNGWRNISDFVSSPNGTRDIQIAPNAVYVLRTLDQRGKPRYSRPFALNGQNIEKF